MDLTRLLKCLDHGVSACVARRGEGRESSPADFGRRSAVERRVRVDVPCDVWDQICVAVFLEVGVHKVLEMRYKAGPLGVILVGESIDEEVQRGTGVAGELIS